MTNRAFEFAASVPWAMEEKELSRLLEISCRQGEDLAALSARLGRPLKNTHTVTTRESASGDKVAVVPVVGPVFRRANLFTEVSGATSHQVLATDFQQALDNPDIKAIVMEFDSPGGEVNGTNEMAKMIRDARGTKPIIAYVGSQAASAAYWMASACERIVMDETAAVGSIGVIMTMSGEPDEEGTYRFISSQSPDKRIDPSKSEGKKKLQREVDSLADIFVGAVAANRGVSEQVVLDDFGKGGVLYGRDAVAAGMADAIGSLESVIAEVLSGSGDKSGGAKTKNKTTIKTNPKGKGAKMEPENNVTMSAEQYNSFLAMQEQMAAMQETLKEATAAREIAEKAAAEAAAEAAIAERNARTTRLNAAAEKFAEGKVAAGHVIPASANAASALHAMLAEQDEDDDAAGTKVAFTDGKGEVIANSRVELLDAALKGGVASTENNWLTDESLKAEQAKLLLPESSDDEAFDADAILASFNAARGHGKAQ